MTINRVPVQFNNLKNPHLLQCIKCARLFNQNPIPFLSTQAKVKVGDDRTKNSLPIKTGLRAFDHVTWDSNRAVRLPNFLDGIWPFDSIVRTEHQTLNVNAACMFSCQTLHSFACLQPTSPFHAGPDFHTNAEA